MKTIVTLLIVLISYLSFGNIKISSTDAFSDDDKGGVIRGIILDALSKQPMEFANIAIYNSGDSSLIGGGITNSKGEFEIIGLSEGNYFLEAQFIGFEKTKKEDVVLNRANNKFDSGEIMLAPSSIALEDINVTAEKAAVEFKLDKKVVNVSQVISAVGGTAVDVLENTPSVQVDIEGNVTLRGSSSFTVLIDGRPSVLSGSDALRQIPASALENIEIITNPSAKYEPDGMAGIINLVTKKNKLQGMSGVVNASAGTGDKYRGDFTLNYRTKKVNWFAGADWRDETNYGSMVLDRATILPDTTFYRYSEGENNDIRGGSNIKTGAEFFLSDKSTLGVSGEIGNSKNSRVGEGKIRYYTQPSSGDVFSIDESESVRENDFYNLNMNFQHNFNNEGHKLDALIFYSGEEGTDSELESEIVADENFNRTNEYLDRVSTMETENENEFRFQLDYTNPFSENGKLEAGMLSRMERETEQMQFLDFDENSNEWVENPKYTSTTEFKRDIHAVYSTFSNKLGEVQYMAGLRGELTQREILNTNNAAPSSLNRFDLFPSVHFSYGFKESNELSASYGRRINRPSGRDLDPNPNYYNRFTIRIGNPDLNPEYTNSYEVNYLKRFGRSFLSGELFHRVTNNKIERTERLGDDGVIYLETDNFDKNFSTGVEVMGNLSATKWLMLNTSVSVYHNRLTGDLYGDNIQRESTNVSGRLNATFNLASNSKLQAMGFYRGPSVSPQGESKAMFFSSLSFRQDFFEKKLSATLSLRDPFGTGKFERETNTDTFKNYFKWSREPRVVMLTLSYKINNFKSEGRSDGGGSGGGMDFGGEY